MGRYILRKAISVVLVLFAISVLTFLIFQVIPNGDPAQRMAGRLADEQQIQDVRETWGFDKPIYVQYVNTMKLIFTGEVVSYTQQLNVMDQIKRDLPATISLAIGASILWLVIGVLFGILSALHAGKKIDTSLTVLAMIGVSMPVFFLGAMGVYFFGYKLNLLPVSGYVGITQNPWQWFTHLLMPWIVLSILYVGIYSRVMRGSILDTMNEDYVRTARAKGLGERQVMLKHVLRNSMIPVISLFGLDFAAVIGGAAILTESIFNLQGVGQYAAESVDRLDVPPVLVITMLGAFAVVVISAIVDVIFAYLDPRIRL
jgi:peptide/nickel transport system permease protein